VSGESFVIDVDPKPTEKAVVSSAYTHRGRKVYELKNHLGNVLAVVSDVKIGLSTSSQMAYYVADVVELTDYEPFRMPLAMRHFVSGDGYRFGFQGQEGDDEWNGEGSMLAFKYRVHDVRLGRFLSVDPLEAKYPWNSTYAFAENKVISFGELEGLEGVYRGVSGYCVPFRGILYYKNQELDHFSRGEGYNAPYEYRNRTSGCAIIEPTLEPINDLAMRAFSHYLPQRLLAHYQFGSGLPYKLTYQEVADCHILPIGLYTPKINEIAAGQIDGIAPCESRSICIESPVASSNTAGTLGQCTVRIRGEFYKSEEGWDFKGEMQIIDKWDFNIENDAEKKARAASTGMNRTDLGIEQTKLGHDLLIGTGFPVESPWIPVNQSSKDHCFDVFEGADHSSVPNKLSRAKGEVK
jgi:RHS repeat-associated protein